MRDMFLFFLIHVCKRVTHALSMFLDCKMDVVAFAKRGFEVV